MLHRMLKIKTALSATMSDMTGSPNNLQNSEWEVVQECVDLLRPLEKLTAALSGEKYPTLSSVIPLIRNVQAALVKKLVNTGIGQELKKSLLDAVEKRLGISESNKTAAKSTYLDPGFKKIGFGLESNADRAMQSVQYRKLNLRIYLQI